MITSDLRNANGGQSSGPIEIDRPWDVYADDRLGLMDHPGTKEYQLCGNLKNINKIKYLSYLLI